MKFPINTQVEAAALGSVIMRPALWPEVSATVNDDDFTADAHQAIYRAIRALVDAQQPIDILTVAREAKVPALLVRDIVEATPLAGAHHARAVATMAAQRRVMKIAQGIVERVAVDDPGEVVGEMIPRLQDAATTGLGHLEGPAELADAALAEMERGAPTIATGIVRLDRALGGGLHRGRLYLVAARTAVGKSAFAGNVVRRALDRDLETLLVSLEMSGVEMLTRLVADAYSVDARDLPAVVKAMASDRVQAWPLRFLARSDLAGIVATTRRLLPRLVVIDYLQLVPTGERFERRDLELAHITRTLKRLATTADVPILACAQLNRDPAKAGRAPKLSDLRESGAQEQDADVVILLDRDVDDDKRETRAILAKNRQGPTGTVDLYFDALHTRFRELTEEVA